MSRYTTVALAAVVIGLGLFGLSVAAAPAGGEAAVDDAVLHGRSTTADGEALEGVALSAQAEGSTVTTTVYTDEGGEYYFPPLPAGAYQVWAQAVGFDIARATVRLDASGATHQAFTLSQLEDFSLQLSGSEWIESLPDDTREDRRMREVFRVNCTECHQPNLVLQSRFDEAGWRVIIEQMDRPRGRSMDGADDQTAARDTTMSYHKDDLAKYLARVRGPDSSLPLKRHPRPTGDAARVVITEYDVPPAETPDELSWTKGSDWTEGTSAGGHFAVGIHDLQIDADGDAWFTESPGGGRTVGKVNAATGQVTGFNVFDRDGKTPLRTHGIGKDPDGNLWFDAYGPVGKITPATEEIELFYPPERMGSGAFLTTDADKDGKIWTGTRYGSIQFDPETERFKYFQNLTPADGTTYGMTVDAQGNGWWTTFWADIVTKADPITGERTEFKITHPPDRELTILPEEQDFYERVGALTWGFVNTVPGVQGTRRLGADRNGTSVWVPLYYGMALAEIDINTHEVTRHPLPIMAHPYFVVVDKHSKVWTNLMSDDRVAKFDPVTEEYTFYKLPTLGCETRNIAVDDLRGDVWVPCIRASKVVRLEFRTPSEIAEVKSTSTLAAEQ
jgi:streptogramin lyase